MIFILYIQFPIIHCLGNYAPNRRESAESHGLSFKIPVLPILRDLGVVPPRGKKLMCHGYVILIRAFSMNEK